MDSPSAPNPKPEQLRLAALGELGVLDTEAEREFDALARVTASIMGVPNAGISLVDADRQWFKASHGIEIGETPRDIAFCDQVVARGEALLIADTLESEEFAGNPLVTGHPRLRFYAGAPLMLDSGECVGSLCALDTVPHPDFPIEKLDRLRDLATLASELLEARGRRLRGEIAAKIVSATPHAVMAANHRAEIVYWNTAAEKMFGLPAAKAIGRNVMTIIPKKFHHGHQERFEAAAEGGPTRLVGTFVELEARHADGTVFPVELSLAPWGSQDMGGFAAVIRDTTDQMKLRAERDRNKQFLDAVVSNLPSMLFVKDTDTRRYLLVNRKAEEVIGRSAESMKGKSDAELFPGAGQTFEHNDLKVITQGGTSQTEAEFERDDATRVHIRTTRVLIDGPDRPNQYLLGLSEDITSMRKTEAARWRLANYDTLTGLLNRGSMLAQIERLIEAEHRFAILNIDLDRFKSVNDQFGHVTGDEVLKVVGARLADLSDENTQIARIGGDEFVCLMTGERLRERAARCAEMIIAGLRQPIKTRGITAHLGASIGVVLYPDDGRCVESLRQNSDLAMYRAKNEAKGEPCFFDDEMDAAERDRRTLERDMRTAIEEGRIDIAYQPIVCVATGEITSVEALARWSEPDRGAIPPDIFIALAEDCGLIDELGEQILRRACIDGLAWPEKLKVAVNLSPRQFYSGMLTDTVLRVVEETGFPAHRLQFEITENLVIQNAAEAFSQLEELKSHGIGISIDDFGIGYSSLSYFQSFSFNKVKIDKSFVSELDHSKAAKAIVQAVVGLATQLSMSVVAEGVETPLQRQMLEDLGCSHLQGYLISRPVSASVINAMVISEAALLPA